MVTLKESPVHSDPGILGGTLVFRGTRVPVQTLLDYLNDGSSIDDFLDNFPTVSRDQIDDFLILARKGSDEDHS